MVLGYVVCMHLAIEKYPVRPLLYGLGHGLMTPDSHELLVQPGVHVWLLGKVKRWLWLVLVRHEAEVFDGVAHHLRLVVFVDDGLKVVVTGVLFLLHVEGILVHSDARVLSSEALLFVEGKHYWFWGLRLFIHYAISVK